MDSHYGRSLPISVVMGNNKNNRGGDFSMNIYHFETIEKAGDTVISDGLVLCNKKTTEELKAVINSWTFMRKNMQEAYKCLSKGLASFDVLTQIEEKLGASAFLEEVKKSV